MKWLVFTSLVVVGLVSLGILAVDERNVVWEAEKPHCPYCRSEIPFYSVVCKGCRHAMDWAPHARPCEFCLDAPSAELLESRFRLLKLDPKNLPEEFEGFTAEYFRLVGGDCTYCGGTGTTAAEGGTGTVPCTVCRGNRRCVACDGDQEILVGDVSMHRRLQERKEARRRAEWRASLNGRPVDPKKLLDEDVEALAGSLEALSLMDGEGRKLVNLAAARMRKAFDVVNRAAARLDAERAGS